MAYKLISQLAHAEIFSPKPDETLWFFTDLMGLHETGREGQSVYLRAWQDPFHHSLKITEGPHPGLGHAAFRTDGAQELEDAAKRLEAAGVEGRWIDGDLGHGRAYQAWMPGGHLFELFWDVDRYEAPAELKSVYPNRPQRRTDHGAGVNRIDHVTVMSGRLMDDVELIRDQLGMRFTEASREGDHVFFATLTAASSNHDYAILSEIPGDETAKPGRYNHISWFLDSREDELRANDLLVEHGFKLDYGPVRHGIGEHFSSYLYEPGGNYVELQANGYWNDQPDWETAYWETKQGGNNGWQISQFSMQQSPPPEVANWQSGSASPSQQYTARERENDQVRT